MPQAFFTLESRVRTLVRFTIQITIKNDRYLYGGESGIRTRDASCLTYTLSKRAPSTTRTPLRVVPCRKAYIP